MRKFLLLLSVFALLACTKTYKQEYVTITIGLSVGDSGKLPSKGLAEDISATLPNQISLTITNKANGDSYEVTTGQTIRVPAGTYTAVGKTSPAPYQFIYDPTHYTSREPLIVVEDELELTSGGTHYVTGQYRCFVVATNTNEVSLWTLRSGTSQPNVAANSGDGVNWIFVIGDFYGDYFFRTNVTFTDGSVQEYQFQTRDLASGSILAEYGKWYLLRQTGGSPQMGTIGLHLAEWVSGN